MTTNPTPDAVEALRKALDEIHVSARDAECLLDCLKDEGFTIAPIGVAKQPETQSVPALTRQPASAAQAAPMTDAELEREALRIADGIRMERDNYTSFIKLAKKYRG